ncbi:L-asparaginase domain protein [Enterobacter hormaechei subsp. xiangfangensis]|nr:isoaspartyl peptidase/L-asparaginase [Enterobacter hormaechei]KHG49417.1 L-asparaginase domain protein [Enterobacter hormaechei subsp. xiangfangensis]
MSKAVIAIHGGAGAITRAQLSPEQEKRYIDALNAIVETGQRMLEAGAARWTWDRSGAPAGGVPLFNAGLALRMPAALKPLRNPVLAARLVMEQSPHVLLAGAGAENLPRARDGPAPFSAAERTAKCWLSTN